MTVSITVLGVVQGVGYRPFVARLAQELGITGTVLNSGGIVKILAEGTKEAMDIFVHRLRSQQPPGAAVERVLTKEALPCGFRDFRIVASEKKLEQIPLIPPDLPMCDTCKSELYDPRNRRFGYPFISCVACGPRYSIMNALPYDREATTMEDFSMCPSCEAEYIGDDRRRHAQTISCHDCGPQLILQAGGIVYNRGEALKKGIEMLRQGAVLAVKGIGGYQLACSPYEGRAVERLRLLKRREKKPFAVMFPGLQKMQEVCEADGEEKKLLLSPARPIVLLRKKTDRFCMQVSGESRFLGAFLAYTPLHQLLTDACGPLVMTSGNLTGEPIILNDEDMLRQQSDCLDGVLYNLRRIVVPLDDSVARVICGRTQVIRRSRGYVPLPLFLRQKAKSPVLAMGGDLKSCFCLYQDDRAYLSQYFGDMEQYKVALAYRQNLERMRRMLGIAPGTVACDLHPNYETTRLAQKTAQTLGVQPVFIQHHHAHVASVMAEHGLDSCIGVAFDGTGYGTDGAVWGSEFLLCRGADYRRCAHLAYVTLCGGDTAAKNAELAAQCYLYAAGQSPEGEFSAVSAAIRQRINTQQTASMGRLFDAVSAALGIKKENSYEGECAVALENAAAAAVRQGIAPYALHFAVQYDRLEYRIDPVTLFRELCDAVRDGADRGALALGFHYAVAEMVLAVCSRIREESGENRVALSGGVFASFLLTQDCMQRLGRAGFAVYLNERVPTNDGGICLGQAWLCGRGYK